MKIIKVGAVRCAGCLVMGPLFKEIEAELPRLKTEYYDYDANPEVIEEFQLDGNIPYFVFLDKDENVLEKINGEFSKKEIMERIEKYKDF